MENRNKTLLEIFLTFLRIGAFTFGGGYAMIPLIQKETVEKHGAGSCKNLSAFCWISCMEIRRTERIAAEKELRFEKNRDTLSKIKGKLKNF